MPKTPLSPTTLFQRPALSLLALSTALAMPVMVDAQPLQSLPASSGEAPRPIPTLTPEVTTMAYPASERGTTVEEQFGVKVADPYRWLEDDVRTSAKSADWVRRQSDYTKAYLAKLPGRAALARRMTELYNYERFSIPVKRGTRYFYTRNDGLQNQSVLYVREGVNGAGRQLLDPNGWSKDGATALAEWTPSDDGKRLAYAVQDGGTDWRILRIVDVDSGKQIDADLQGLKFGGGVDWTRDGSGFYYSRYPLPAPGQAFQSLNKNQAVYFHKLGTPQLADTLVYATPATPDVGHGATLTEDGRYLVLSSHLPGGGDGNELRIIDLKAADRTPRTLFSGYKDEWSLLGNVGPVFYLKTDKDAANNRIVRVDIRETTPTVTTVVPEAKATLQGANIVGNRIIGEYLVDAKTEVRQFALDGKPLGTIALPGMGSAGGFGGKMTDGETFYSYTSFATPASIYRLDIASGRTSVWAAPKMLFNPDDYSVEQRFYASKDGTRVPIYIVAKKGFDRSKGSPTLLTSYGGFNISILPGYSVTRMAWLDAGGVFALANIRGGGEYGKAWHDGGRLLNKQNVFDDFIAAGEYLKREGVTGKTQLAIEGRSNGGLLVGAVLNQRPDLFDAALPSVGVMDMLRFNQFTAGRFWVDDYGVPQKEADFRNLWKISPYHNVRSGVHYPATLVVTADTDDRVVPGHSFKYAAALQQADIGPKPHLIRIETRAGHGSGKPVSKTIEEFADLYAFIAYWTGLKID